MGKKIKKHKLILLELKRRRERNDKYCDLNSDCNDFTFINGSNKIIDEMIKFIEKLK